MGYKKIVTNISYYLPIPKLNIFFRNFKSSLNLHSSYKDIKTPHHFNI